MRLPYAQQFRRLPIRRKLVLLMVLTSALGMLLLIVGIVSYERFSYENRLQREFTVLGNVLADSSNAALVFGDKDLLAHNVESLKQNKDVMLGCIYNAQQEVVASYEPRPGIQCPATAEASEGTFRDEAFFMTQPITLDGDRVGWLHVRASLQELESHLNNSLLTLLVVASLVGLVIWGVSNVLQRFISAPVVHLTETASGIARRKDYSLRAVKESDDEIGQLVETFNDMIDTIESQNEALEVKRESLERVVAQRTEQLRSSNRELEAFSYSVSHDLRQPLRAIDGFSMAILEDCGDQLDATAHEYLERVRRASQRMGTLIDGMLHLSRVTRQELRIGNVDLSKMAREIVNSLHEQQPGREVDVTIQPGILARGDEKLLRIALSNLIGNAWKYTGQTPHPRIEVAVRRVRDARPVYLVRDNGVGFDMQYADQLFQVFQRMHSVAEFEGSGIGLATVHRVIQRHGGEIWAESEPGKGATFYFTLAEPNGQGLI